MHDDSPLVRARIARFLDDRLRPALHRHRARVAVAAWEVPGEPVPFAEASAAGEYQPIAPGAPWGRPWGTTWFRVTGDVPAEWAGESDSATPELAVDLGFASSQPGFQAEGLVWTTAGEVVKAIEPRSAHVPLGAPGSSVDFFIEAASNPDLVAGARFRPTRLGDPETAGTDSIYRLGSIAVVLRDREVAALLAEATALLGLYDVLGGGTSRGAEVLRALQDLADEVDPFDIPGTAPAGRALLRRVLDKPAAASAHRVTAVGHAHIDSAWLWPVRETVRKVARTFSNVLQLMDDDPDFVFAASSAQQYAWLKRDYPELFERVRARVAEGRFVPVGGMWVESDTNLPGGEALARQFVQGSSFFLREFGVEPEVVWLPDSFGYSGALPQLARAAGARYFLTQKISWNDTNRFPHHTFQWEGIDGTRILTHFPPVDTYNAELSAVELGRAERQFAEKGRASRSLMPFGFGDGGGGPTREMIAAGRVAADLEGSPRVEFSSPGEFFRAAEADYVAPPVWSGELYLELHRGTYTSQARAKRGNRRSESLLHEAELWAAQATLRVGLAYPYDELERCWQTVLLNQFHDILPGSSIAWVYRVAEAEYAEVAHVLETVIARSLAALGAAGAAGADAPGDTAPEVGLANPGPFSRDGVTAGAVGAAAGAALASLTAQRRDDAIVLRNEHAEFAIDATGRVTRAVDRRTGREAVPPGQRMAELQLLRDTPTAWDAWDVDALDRRSIEVLDAPESVELAESAGGGPEVRVVHRRAATRIELRFTLLPDAPTLVVETRADWHERQRLLKLAFPIDVQADRALSEIQFGHIARPIVANTSWDAARFETSAHRWVHVGEAGFGAAIADDASYGHDVTRVARVGGGVFTLVRQSLLRAPLYPDPEADQGEHTFTSSVTLGASVGDAIREGYRINLPARPAAGAVPPLVVVSGETILVETVKLAEDRSGDLIVRLYESRGGRAEAALAYGIPVAEVYETDLLERRVEPAALRKDGSLELRPFQVVTLRARI